MSLPAIVLTEAQKDETCRLISSGERIKQVCNYLGIVESTLYGILNKDPIFAKQFKESREHFVHSKVETLIGITDGCVTMPDVQAARLESDNIKWVASKALPGTYGDTMNINHNHTLDLSSILLAAESRILPILQQAKREERATTGILEGEIISESKESGNSSEIDDLI